MRLGFVVNPIAGMGGRVGLKGTDGKVQEARRRGAEPRAPDRARRALEALREQSEGDVDLVTWGGSMGADVARAVGFDAEVLGGPGSDPTDGDDGEPGVDGRGTADEAPPETADEAPPETSAEDTARAVEAFLDDGVDIVVFVGGDGTAADVAEVVEGTEIPILGVPAGVKVYSSVFAVSPEDAAHVVATFERTERREVLDIDEDEYREGEVHPELRAIAHVPVAEELQSSKQLGGGNVEALAAGVADDIRGSEKTFVLGPGSTVGAIKEELGFEGSPIGVDVWRDGEVLALDASESEILDALGPDGENVVVVSPIGGQGFVFGRGNPQLSPAVIRRSDVEIVASRSKLDTIGELRVDTDDPELDAELRGWTKVRIGRFERRMMRIA
ncbi:ATP-NAD kinase family protein [Halobellus limi]|uniref:N-acetylglucosamine-1-phosphate uridyltransferase n=1 Tax=Halobellus limi TaxID=699433 RepID=A0A1H5Z889_9EURY|nr:ATP-NAD kinase family protein [Halobellus limi]QCC48176.1 N-acetylglucosamine-1-phosphate uridyltransferase [Halobellus limi]SEG32743.1 Predicted polyphosphate-or ATP-dependent NAD kinase [Halobellus limi]